MAITKQQQIPPITQQQRITKLNYTEKLLPHQNFEDNRKQYRTKGFCYCPRQKDQSKNTFLKS